MSEKLKEEISKGCKIPVEQLFGKRENDGIGGSFMEKYTKFQIKRLKKRQKEVGKMIKKIFEKKYPEFKGKFEVEWEKFE